MNIDPQDYDPIVDERLRGALGEARPLPIYGASIVAEASRQRRVRWIAGSVAGLATALAVVVAVVMIAPGMTPKLQAVPAGPATVVPVRTPDLEGTPVPTTRPPDVTPAPTDEVVPTDEATPDTANLPAPVPTVSPDITTGPSCDKALQPVVPDKTWTRYNMPNVGVSVMLPKGMKAYLDKELDNGWRLDSVATHNSGGGEVFHEMLVWPESLAGGSADGAIDLCVPSFVQDAAGRDVRVGMIDFGDWREYLLMVSDNGARTNLIDFGKGKFYFGSDDNWSPMSKADRNTIVAILASVRPL